MGEISTYPRGSGHRGHGQGQLHWLLQTRCCLEQHPHVGLTSPVSHRCGHAHDMPDSQAHAYSWVPAWLLSPSDTSAQIPVLLFTPWDPCSPDGLAWCSLANICTHPTGTPYLQIPPVTSMGPLLTCYIYLELGPSAHQLVQVRACQLFCTPCTSSFGKVQTQPQHLAPGTQAVTHGPASVADSACKQIVWLWWLWFWVPGELDTGMDAGHSMPFHINFQESF